MRNRLSSPAVRGGPGRLHQRGPERGTPLGRLACPALARGCVMAWTQPRPLARCPAVGTRPMSTPISATSTRALLAHTRNGLKQGHGFRHARGGTLFNRPPHVGLSPSQGRFECIIPRQQRPAYPPLGRRQATIERTDSLGLCPRQGLARHVRHRWGSGLTRRQRPHQGAATDAEGIARHLPALAMAPRDHLLDPVSHGVRTWQETESPMRAHPRGGNNGRCLNNAQITRTHGLTAPRLLDLQRQWRRRRSTPAPDQFAWRGRSCHFMTANARHQAR